MEQRCQNILQNYLKTTEYNTDYKIINSMFLNYCFKIYYKTNVLFLVYNNNYYIKYNNCQINKNYTHNEYFYYYNNKNNYILLNKKQKIIYSSKDYKYYIYTKFFQIYKKMIKNYLYLFYYCKIQPFNLYIYKMYKNYINIKNYKLLYSNLYSILYLII